MSAQNAGHRCGYVEVPEGHPWHGLDYDAEVDGSLDLEQTLEDAYENHGVVNVFLAAVSGGERSTLDLLVKVHGGLTYARDRLAGVEGKSWWLGFDCAHAWDAKDESIMSERLLALEREMAAKFPRDEDQRVWTEEDVAAETERLAAQIASVA